MTVTVIANATVLEETEKEIGGIGETGTAIVTVIGIVDATTATRGRDTTMATVTTTLAANGDTRDFNPLVDTVCWWVSPITRVFLQPTSIEGKIGDTHLSWPDSPCSPYPKCYLFDIITDARDHFIFRIVNRPRDPPEFLFTFIELSKWHMGRWCVSSKVDLYELFFYFCLLPILFLTLYFFSVSLSLGFARGKYVF